MNKETNIFTQISGSSYCPCVCVCVCFERFHIVYILLLPMCVCVCVCVFRGSMLFMSTDSFGQFTIVSIKLCYLDWGSSVSHHTNKKMDADKVRKLKRLTIKKNSPDLMSAFSRTMIKNLLVNTWWTLNTISERKFTTRFPITFSYKEDTFLSITFVSLLWLHYTISTFAIHCLDCSFPTLYERCRHAGGV